MNRTNHVCRIRIFPKAENSFRIQGREVGKFVYVTLAKFTLGKLTDSDSEIVGTETDKRPLRVTVKDREIWIEDSGSSGAVISGKALQPNTPFPYRSGEVIQLGQSDLLATIDLYSRHVEPRQEADSILREAEARSAAAASVLREAEAQAKQLVDAALIESAAAVNKGRIEAERLLTAAQRQIEERTRQAIEEGHAQAQELQKQAKAEAEKVLRHAEQQANELLRLRTDEGDKIVARSKSAADALVVSAKNEVELLLKEAQTKADAIAHEGEDRKKVALETSEALKADLLRIQQERALLENETARTKAAYEEERNKRQTLLHQIEEIESNHAQAQARFDFLKGEMAQAEDEWRKRIDAQKKKSEELNAQMQKAVDLKRESETRHSDLERRAVELKTELQTLDERHAALVSKIKSSEGEQTRWTNEIQKLQQTYEVELAKLRQKVDAEYERQLKAQEAHFAKQREQENLIQEHLLKRLEILEEKRLGQQIASTHERLWTMISDRAALYGLSKVQENAEFKKDLGVVAAQVIREEFELRRRQVVTAMPAPGALRRRRRSFARAAGVGGWALALALFGVLVSSAFIDGATVGTREPAHQGTVPGSETDREPKVAPNASSAAEAKPED